MPRLLPLHTLHTLHGAVFGAFHGWRLPLSYAGQSILESVLHTRRHASIFDISHLRRHHLCAPNETTMRQALHALLPIDYDGCGDGTLKYCLLLNASGGILDDVMLTKINHSHYTLVTNAATESKVTEHLRRHAQRHGISHYITERVCLAVQGPKAAEWLFDGGYSRLKWMTMTMSMNSTSTSTSTRTMAATVPTTTTTSTTTNSDVFISRCGYTGEDGFEIECSEEVARGISSHLLGKGAKWAGLGARDILRIEAGLPLYGQELDESITPVKAGLSWTIDKRRRRRNEENTPPFPGKEHILFQLAHKDSIERRRIGLISSQPHGPIPRTGMPIFDSTQYNDCIGIITSGTYSSHLKANIAMAYVTSRPSKLSELFVRIRDQMYPYVRCQLPFIPHHYIKEVKSI